VDPPGSQAEGLQTINALATDGSRVVAVGASLLRDYTSEPTDRALVWASDDMGRTWQAVEAEALDTEYGFMNDVTWTGNGFIAAGSEFWFSSDGLRWELTTRLEGGDRVRRATPWQSRWFAAGWSAWSLAEQRASVWVSDDGMVWEEVFIDPAEGSSAYDLLIGPNGLVVVGHIPSSETWHTGGPETWHSSDGLTWERDDWEPPEDNLSLAMQSVAWFGDWLISSGNGSFWGSHNPASRGFLSASSDGGRTWNVARLPEALFDVYIEEFGDVSVMRFPADADGDRLVLTGSHNGDAAIWVGTFEE
jgi:hypothetical protein